ncbi:MAG: VCBS repeat-containing protein, partial [Planctomycetota bacterium]
ALEIPQNTTVDELAFTLHYEYTDPSPGDLSFDIDQDGTPEWAFGGTGYGQLGNQTLFSDGALMDYASRPDGVSSGPKILLPANISIANSLLAIDFNPDNDGKWLTHAGLIDVTSSDLDKDGTAEVIVLSNDFDGNNNPGIGWVDSNSSNNSFSGIEWVQTCADSEHLEVGDFNGDGHADIIAWTPLVGRFCYHLWMPSQEQFSAATTINGPPTLAGVVVADFNADGFADLVYSDPIGSFTYMQWKSTISTFEEIDSLVYYTTVNGTSQNSSVEQIGVGNIMGGTDNATLILVSSFDTLDTFYWDPAMNAGAGGFAEVAPSYANIEQEFLWVADLNGDQWSDILTWDNGTTGRLLLSDGNTGLYSSIPQSGMSAPVGAVTTDFDQDGQLDILIPEAAPADLDNNDATLNGSLMVYSLNLGVLTNTMRSLEPRTMPSAVIATDMTGDGRDELIAISGESTIGLFIDSWHAMRLDFDGNGIPEVTIEGFGQAQSGPNGSQLLRFTDVNNDIATAIELNLAGYWHFFDANGTEMIQLNSSFDLDTPGTVMLANMRLTYNFDHRIENFSGGGNLTQMVNSNYMEFGDQNFNVSLPFNATLPGSITLQELRMVTHPGHPDLP